VAIGDAPEDFYVERMIDATAWWSAPAWSISSARLREPGL
jgi:hypothetical protein